MQTILHVIAKPTQKSLRSIILSDLKRPSLQQRWGISSEKKSGRTNGWASVTLKGHVGALKLEWDQDTKTLVGRVITKAGNKPDGLVGAFIEYLLQRHSQRIASFSIRSI